SSGRLQPGDTEHLTHCTDYFVVCTWMKRIAALASFFFQHTRPLRASPLRRRALLHSSPPCANGQSARSCFLYKRGVRPSNFAITIVAHENPNSKIKCPLRDRRVFELALFVFDSGGIKTYKNCSSGMHPMKSMKPRALPTSGLASGGFKNEKSLSGSTFSSCDELHKHRGQSSEHRHQPCNDGTNMPFYRRGAASKVPLLILIIVASVGAFGTRNSEIILCWWNLKTYIFQKSFHHSRAECVIGLTFISAQVEGSTSCVEINAVRHEWITYIYTAKSTLYVAEPAFLVAIKQRKFNFELIIQLAPPELPTWAPKFLLPD
ncbi:unnamed protein product, partial [Trichogramma brassicae]